LHLGHGSKKSVAQAARRVFQIPPMDLRFAGNIGASAFEFQLEIFREGFHEALVFIRFRTSKLVVEMQDEKRDPKVCPQLRENPEHCDRIRAARNAHTNPVARPNHGVPADGFEDSFVEILFHRNERGGGLPRWAQAVLPSHEL